MKEDGGPERKIFGYGEVDGQIVAKERVGLGQVESALSCSSSRSFKPNGPWSPVICGQNFVKIGRRG